MISSATENQISQIVKIHCESLPDDFLPRLGKSFLRETFYPAVIDSDQAELLVEVDQNGIVVGFVITTLDSGSFLSSIIKKNIWSFAATGLRSSFRSLKQFRNNLAILITSLFSNEQDQSGEIYIIAVDPGMRGKRIGANLIKAAEEYLIKKNIPAIKIKTLSSNTDWIHHFQKSGWEIKTTLSLIGNEYTVLGRDL